MMMKFLNKTSVKRILLIVLCALVILPFVLDLMKVDIKEGFSEVPNSDKYSSNNIKINRIITKKGPNFDVNAENGALSESDASFAYCVSKQDTDMKCSDGALDVSFSDLSFSYGDGLVGTTYDSVCNMTNNDGTKTEVENASFICAPSGMNELPTTLYGVTKNPDSNKYDISKTISLELNGTDASFSGFTQNFESVPLRIDASGDLIMYQGNEEYVKTLKCYLFDSSVNCDKQFVDAYDGADNTEAPVDEKKCEEPINIKCLANFGTKIGEPLCCGQTGVLQNTDHVCPQEMPHCAGYKCGSQWGVCKK
jgi:hypothetical protein